MLYTSLPREGLLSALPKGRVGCEIGVNRGDFSAKILAEASPKRLHLIDPWNFGLGDPQELYLNPGDGDAVHEAVRRRFASEMLEGQLQIHRETSASAALGFQREYFDWIYIDGDHRYEAVLADLRIYAPLVKPDGFILGDDYTEPTFKEVREMNFGVVQAVKEFSRESGWSLIALTDGVWANYVLAKDAKAASSRRLLSIIEGLSERLTIIPDPLRTTIAFHEHVLPSGKLRLIRHIAGSP